MEHDIQFNFHLQIQKEVILRNPITQCREEASSSLQSCHNYWQRTPDETSLRKGNVSKSS